MSHRTSLEDRLYTYHGWPMGSCQHPNHLAAAGFEYEGNGDLVHCPSCRLRLFDWIPSNPLEQHGKFSEYKCSLYTLITERQGCDRHQAYNNIVSPTGAVLEPDLSQMERHAVTPGITSDGATGAFNGVQMTNGAMTSLMRDHVQPNLQDSRECVDAVPSYISESRNDQPRHEHDSEVTDPVIIMASDPVIIMVSDPVIIMVSRATTVEVRVQQSIPMAVGVHGVSTSGSRNCIIEQCTDGGELISVAGRHAQTPQSVRRAA